MRLKDYQARALDQLENYYKFCKESNAADAFKKITEQWKGIPSRYHSLSSLNAIPYVCLRIPTGGGKTLVGGLAIERANRSLMFARFSITLWLVPSEPIRTQTLKALRSQNNLLHQMIFASLENLIVLDIEEALRVKPHVLNSANVIIVSTMQSFKREKTEDLNTYKMNADMLTHFEGVADPDLRGNLSFVDMLRTRHPYIIVDEAHNQGTPLAFETLTRFEPSGILELTATPDRTHQPSNVLFSVSAASLQAADMIKMPLELVRRRQPQDAVRDAINCLSKLNDKAIQETKATGRYIRPIMLIQAEKHSANHETLEPHKVKEMLVTNFDVSDEEIVIVTGKQDDLGNENVLSNESKIKYIITIDKLREGWDCPFAYVLCSFRNSNSKVATEQILGRIMRMPYALRNNCKDLNEAYVFITSSDFAATVESLREGLIRNGFEREDTRDLIVSSEEDIEEDLFEAKPESVAFELTEELDLTLVSDSLKKKVEVVEEEHKVIFLKKPSNNELNELLSVVKSQEDKQSIKEAVEVLSKPGKKKVKTPSELNEVLSVPLLSIKQGDLWEDFDDTHLLQDEWSLKGFSAELTDDVFKKHEAVAEGGRFVVKEEKIKWEYLDNLEAQLALFDFQDEWSQVELVAWLERNIPELSLLPDEKAAFFNKAVTYLLSERRFTLKELTYMKFRLRMALETRLKKVKREAMAKIYQKLIVATDMFQTIPDNRICFEYGRYDYDWFYSGFRELPKHFFPKIGNLHAKGEEFECAERIAMNPHVKYWVRNVERKPTSFSLQTGTDRFYPDFICKLKDERIMVIEYKNERDWDLPDNEEKRQIGELWAKRSGGKCLFVMPKGKDWDCIKNIIEHHPPKAQGAVQ